MISSDGSAAAASSGSAAGGEPWWHEDPATESSRKFGSTSDSTEALVGAAAAEFVKLAGSVAQWVDRSGVNATLKSFVDQAAQVLDSDAHCDQRVCSVCPICQGMAALSAARPELAESLVEVMTAIGELVHAVAQTLVAGPQTQDNDPPS